MSSIKAKVVSVHIGKSGEFSKEKQASITAEIDGIVGDRHQTHLRACWSGNDKQAEGTVRRNERQWSAMSVEELAQIATDMDLVEPLTAGALGANICIEGIPQLSRLPKGTTFRFPSGAELQVEDFNPPCLHMGKKLAESMHTNSGNPLEDTAFSKASKLSRGLVGIVEVAGEIKPGDEVEVKVYEHPSWLARSSD